MVTKADVINKNNSDLEQILINSQEENNKIERENMALRDSIIRNQK